MGLNFFGVILMVIFMLLMSAAVLYGLAKEYEIRVKYKGTLSLVKAFFGTLMFIAPQAFIVALFDNSGDLMFLDRIRGLWLGGIWLIIGFLCVRSAYKSRISKSIGEFLLDMSIACFGVSAKIVLWLVTFTAVKALKPRDIPKE